MIRNSKIENIMIWNLNSKWKKLAQYKYMLFGRFANENWILRPHSLVLPCEMGGKMIWNIVRFWYEKKVKKKYVNIFYNVYLS